MTNTKAASYRIAYEAAMMAARSALDQRNEAQAELQRLREEFESYVEEKTWAYGIELTAEHNCSMGDKCPVIPTAEAAERSTTPQTPRE